jgi:hypothetical protein
MGAGGNLTKVVPWSCDGVPVTVEFEAAPAPSLVRESAIRR